MTNLAASGPYALVLQSQVQSASVRSKRAERLSEHFRIADQTLERIRRGRPLVLKGLVDLDEARRKKAILSKLGYACRIVLPEAYDVDAKRREPANQNIVGRATPKDKGVLRYPLWREPRAKRQAKRQTKRQTKQTQDKDGAVQPDEQLWMLMFVGAVIIGTTFLTGYFVGLADTFFSCL